MALYFLRAWATGHFRTCTKAGCTRQEGSGSVPNCTDFGGTPVHHFGMKKRNLNRKQLSSVPCPKCGVTAGQRCVLHSGALRSEPHVDRKLSAIEAIERNLRWAEGGPS